MPKLNPGNQLNTGDKESKDCQGKHHQNFKIEVTVAPQKEHAFQTNFPKKLLLLC